MPHLREATELATNVDPHIYEVAAVRGGRSIPRPMALGAMAIGAMAIGACAVGALAIGRLAIGALSLRHGRVRSLLLDEVTIARLEVRELVLDPAQCRTERAQGAYEDEAKEHDQPLVQQGRA